VNATTPSGIHHRTKRTGLPIVATRGSSVPRRETGRTLGVSAAAGSAAIDPELQAKYQLYHTAWQEVERTEPPVAMPLMRVVYVAPQTHTAHQEAEAGLMHTYGRYWRWGLLPHAGTDDTALARDRFIIGDPAQVIEEIQGYRNLFGITYLICRMAIPAVPHDHIVRSMHLFSERVAPQLSQEC